MIIIIKKKDKGKGEGSKSEKPNSTWMKSVVSLRENESCQKVINKTFKLGGKCPFRPATV